jgi:hypothetical protein
MIPATFHVPISSAAALPKNVHAHSAKLRQQINPSNATPLVPVPAKLKQPKQSSVHMVRTSFQTSETVGGAQSILLVMHTEQLDDSGRLVWSISMWQLTVFHPAVPQLHRGINPKTT